MQAHSFSNGRNARVAGQTFQSAGSPGFPARSFGIPTRREKVARTGRLESLPYTWVACVLLVTALPAFADPTAIDEDSPWPRVRSTNGNTVTLHLPQVERWTSNWFRARAAVEVKPAQSKKEQLGVIWFESHGTVDHSNRMVTLDRIEITKGRFPDASD